MVRSKVNPTTIRIRRTDVIGSGVQVTVRGRWDVQEVPVENDEGEERTEYAYKECEIVAVMPEEIINPAADLNDQVANWVAEHEPELLAAAKRRYVLDTGKAAE